MPEYSLQRFRDKLAIVWHEGGRRHRHSLGTADRASAEAAARAFWARRGGEIATVSHAIERYFAEKKDMLSIKRAKVAWKAAEGFWGKLSIGRIDRQVAKDYRSKRAHCSPVTVRNELAVIRAALNFCEREKLIPKAPFIEMPQMPPRKIRHLSKIQFRKLVASASAPHIALFMKVAIATGARATAILELTWDRVDFEQGIIDFNPEKRVQTSKYRATVSMNSQLRQALEEARDGSLSDYVIEYGREQVMSIKKGFGSAAKKAGLKATPHMLRHSAAVWMAEDRISMDVIAQFLGHSDSRITSRVYARFSPDFMADAAEALTW